MLQCRLKCYKQSIQRNRIYLFFRQDNKSEIHLNEIKKANVSDSCGMWLQKSMAPLRLQVELFQTIHSNFKWMLGQMNKCAWLPTVSLRHAWPNLWGILAGYFFASKSKSIYFFFQWYIFKLLTLNFNWLYIKCL